jgi:hypothetical protein
LAVTEPQRLALHTAARAALGDEEADTLMALSPPSNTDIATRQDFALFEERLTGQMRLLEERLSGRMACLEERLTGRIDQAISQASAALTRSMHHAELRTMGVIVLASLGFRFLG